MKLLLSCMDYRLVDATGRYMSARGLKNKYDHISLAGASLGALTWIMMLWQHLDIAVGMHKIEKVIVMDHRDCGAYETFKDRDKETEVHTENLNKLSNMIKEKYPGLEVELLLMDLDGKVQNIK